jgi:hypothetical protein
VSDLDGLELVVLEHDARRTPVAAATRELHDMLVTLRGTEHAPS